VSAAALEHAVHLANATRSSRGCPAGRRAAERARRATSRTDSVSSWRSREPLCTIPQS
jgi:hypothetical protein